MGIGRLLMYPFYENGVLKKEFGFLNICASRYTVGVLQLVRFTELD